MSTVTVLGTGLMGAPMARNLLKAGHEVTAWNRTRAKADALADDGARVAGELREAVAGASFVVTMLSDGPAVRAVLDEVADAMEAGATLIDMSSIRLEEAREHATLLAGHDVRALDAPVSGGTKGAAEGTLAIMVGGEASAFDRARPVLEAMGRPTLVGPAGSGQLAKLCNQTIVAITIGAVAEAVLLARKGGADPDAMRAALAGGFADSVILRQHGDRMDAGDYEPGGPSRLQLKDLDNALREAGANGLALPLTEQVRERFHALVHEMDGGNLDHAALMLELERRNA